MAYKLCRELPLGHVVRKQPIFPVPAESHVGISLATTNLDRLARGDFQLERIFEELRVWLVDFGFDQYGERKLSDLRDSVEAGGDLYRRAHRIFVVIEPLRLVERKH